MISIKNLYVSFTKEYDALHNINLEIEKGEKVAIVGEIESGKTTLLRVIAKLEDYKKGEIYINEDNLQKIDYKTDVSLAYVPQMPVFMENKTVLENLQYVLKIRNYDMATINYKILSALSNFNLEHLKNIKIKSLNRYQKILIQLARISMRKADIYLIDDILQDFSQSEQEQILEYLKMLIEENSESTFLFAITNEKYAKELECKIIKLDRGSIKTTKKQIK